MKQKGDKMNEKERINFVYKEIKALYEELDSTINQLVILRLFLKNLIDVANGAEPFYRFNEILKDDYE